MLRHNKSLSSMIIPVPRRADIMKQAAFHRLFDDRSCWQTIHSLENLYEFIMFFCLKWE